MFENGEKITRGKLSVSAWQKGGAPKYTREWLCDLLEAGEKPHMEMFWGHHPSKDGRITKSCFSQWWRGDFLFQGRRMCCMEQCMMWGKALTFQDEETARKILESSDPQQIKKLGRQVKNFDEAVWNEIKHSLILNGNYSKFTQNEALRHFLLSTGDSVLVEASPYDCIWGVGLDAGNPDVRDPRKWKGQNLLGFALMEVRDEIRKACENGALCADWKQE